MSNTIIITTVLLGFIGINLANPMDPKAIDWRIVGGSNAQQGEFPYITSLRMYGSHNCGGALIKVNWVITAAHCIKGYDPKLLSVVIGTNSLSSGGETFEVLETRVHPDYNSILIKNDIALIKLSRNVERTPLVQTVDLACVDRDEPQDCILAGWGTTAYPGTKPDSLQTLKLRSLAVSDCQEKYEHFSQVYANQICTLTKAGEGACHGDSGGPLVLRENGKDSLRGLVSWGYNCAEGYPDVFTRVSSFCDWITENIKD